MARTHELKCWPEPFAALLDGSKTFEFRRDDRGYSVGDILRLREWDPSKGVCGYYMGPPYRDVTAKVTYVLHGGRFGVPAGFVVMGLHVIDAAQATDTTTQGGKGGERDHSST